MDSKTIDDAMRRKLPVMCKGHKYERISEYIMWYDESGKRKLSLVLVKGNTCIRVLAERVELVKE